MSLLLQYLQTRILLPQKIFCSRRPFISRFITLITFAIYFPSLPVAPIIKITFMLDIFLLLIQNRDCVIKNGSPVVSYALMLGKKQNQCAFVSGKNYEFQKIKHCSARESKNIYLFWNSIQTGR